MDKKWTIRSIYMYLVSFATLMMVLLGTINSLEAVFDYYFRPLDFYTPPAWEIKMNMTGVTEEQKISQIQTERDRMEKSARYDIQRRIFNGIAMISVGLPVYLYHWRKIKENIE